MPAPRPAIFQPLLPDARRPLVHEVEREKAGVVTVVAVLRPRVAQAYDELHGPRLGAWRGLGDRAPGAPRVPRAATVWVQAVAAPLLRLAQVTVNPHKMLSVPLQTSMLLTACKGDLEVRWWHSGGVGT